jgi:hypothetical protein
LTGTHKRRHRVAGSQRLVRSRAKTGNEKRIASASSRRRFWSRTGQCGSLTSPLLGARLRTSTHESARGEAGAVRFAIETERLPVSSSGNDSGSSSAGLRDLHPGSQRGRVLLYFFWNSNFTRRNPLSEIWRLLDLRQNGESHAFRNNRYCS